MRIQDISPAVDSECVPLIEVHGLNGAARIIGRCEGHNEYGSIKSRMVRYLLQKALAAGHLRTGDPVIEASSGNTGVALAGIGAELGLEVSIVLLTGTDEAIVAELESLGARIHFCDRQAGMRGMLGYIKATYPDVFSLDQFRNRQIVPAYVETHRDELLAQLESADISPDYLFSCVGTGGTLQGLGTILRQRWPSIRIVAVEKAADANPIDGIRNTQVAYFGDADIYDKAFADETIYIGECPQLPEGLIASPSCAALLEAIRRHPLRPGSTALAVFCDARLAETPVTLSLA